MVFLEGYQSFFLARLLVKAQLVFREMPRRCDIRFPLPFPDTVTEVTFTNANGKVWAAV